MEENNFPKISIITCTYNSEKFLLRALESIEQQTYQNIEHIINDSYSTDASLRIIEEYIERNQEKYTIKVIHSSPKGVGNALNLATKEATGDLIHYLHSDDYYSDATSLEKVALKFRERPQPGLDDGKFPGGDQREAIHHPQHPPDPPEPQDGPLPDEFHLPRKHLHAAGSH